MRNPRSSGVRNALRAGLFTMAWWFAAGHAVAAGPIGIVIAKQSIAHPDATSIAFEFKRVRRQQDVTTYFLPSGKGVRLTKFDPHVVIDYPVLESLVVKDPAEAAPVGKLAESLRETIRTYPKAGPFLAPHLKRAEEIVRRVQGGEVYLEGAYMNGADYRKIAPQLEKIEAERRRQREERARLEVERERRALIEERRRKR